MVWTLAIHKPNRRWVARWDGTSEWIRGHFTPRLIELFNIRVMQDTNGLVLTARTEGSTLFCKSGEWLLLSYWPRLNRWELYWNKDPIFQDDYTLTSETIDVHDDGLPREPLRWEEISDVPV